MLNKGKMMKINFSWRKLIILRFNKIKMLNNKLFTTLICCIL
jgi:hypothetical protein